MSRYAIAGRSTIAGTNLRGQFSLYNLAAVSFAARECGIFNTTTTAFAAALSRFSATGTQGAGLTETKYDQTAPAASCTGFAGHTADATVADNYRQASIGAAIGAGVIWTFGEGGLVVAVGTANGIGITIPTGSGQISDYSLDWDE